MGGGSSKKKGPAPARSSARRLSLPPLAFADARSKEPKVRAAFDAMDANGDGTLQPEEVQAYLAKMGYCEDEGARFVRLADVDGDAAVDFNEFHAAWGFLNAYRVTGHTAGVVERRPGSVAGVDVVIEDCRDCEVRILDRTAALQIDNCHNVTFVLGPCEGSCFVRDCSGCTVSLATRQLRTRDCADCRVFLYAATEPIVETSTGLLFAPFNARYDGLAGQFKDAGFDPALNLWYAVYDFSSPDARDAAHWREMDAADWADKAVEPCAEPNPVPRDARGPIPEDSMRGTAMHAPPS